MAGLNNFVIVKMYWHEGMFPMMVPGRISLATGDMVMCEINDGIVREQVGTCVCDSFMVQKELVKDLFNKEEFGTVKTKLLKFDLTQYEEGKHEDGQSDNRRKI